MGYHISREDKPAVLKADDATSGHCAYFTLIRLSLFSCYALDIFLGEMTMRIDP
jgi:hypothetical protein